VDDSEGEGGEAGDRLVAAHVRACALAGPDREELAEWLLELQAEGSGLPELLVESYLDVLGENGTERYRTGLFAEDGDGALQVQAVALLRTEFARAVGDTDLLVRTYASGERVYYAAIVAALEEAGRGEEALAWAERGLRDGSGRAEARLVEHVVNAYREAGRSEEVRELRWELFERSPDQRTFRELREDTPEEGWPAVRAQALMLLGRAAARRPYRESPCALVEVLLAEGTAEEVWAAAVEHGGDDGQWIRVAELRAPGHPQDAIDVTVPRLEAMVGRADTGLYPRAAELARWVAGLYRELGCAEEASVFVDVLRSEHRRKRRFLGELDRVGLGG
jgi:uncharacterized Zn finger protein